MTHNNYTAVIKHEKDCWIGWIEEVPGVNCQEATKKNLLSSLKITLEEALEMNKEDAIKSAGADYSEELVCV